LNIACKVRDEKKGTQWWAAGSTSRTHDGKCESLQPPQRQRRALCYIRTYVNVIVAATQVEH
jgi:hypothetical protein